MSDQASEQFFTEAEGILKRNAELTNLINAAAAAIVCVNHINNETTPYDAYPHIEKAAAHIEEQVNALREAIIIHHMTVSNPTTNSK